MNVNAPEQQGSALRFADHVRACALSDQVVLLDLRRSKYLSIGLAHWERLTGGEDPAPDDDACQALVIHYRDARLVEPLVRQGLLTRAPAQRHQLASPPLHLPTGSLDVQGTMPCSAVSAGRMLGIAGATAWAATALRFRSLQHIAARIARRAVLSDTPHAHDDACLHDAVAAFVALRPFLLTARDRCLHDSIALATCLAGEHVACRWVIGVRSRPFAAHAWVQSGGLVLNDLHENARRYQPILVV